MENKMGYAYLDKYGILHIVSSVSSVPSGAKFVGTDEVDTILELEGRGDLIKRG